MFDSVLDQIGVALELQELHHRVFVRRHRSHGDFQRVNNSLHRVTLGQELDHFPLPSSRLRKVIAASGVAQGDVGQPLSALGVT